MSNATISPVCQCPPSDRLQSVHDCPSYTMFTGGHIVINNGNFVQTNSVPVPGEKRGFNLLTEAASPSAFHNAGHQLDFLPLSYQNTAILDKIKGWLSDTSDVPLMWLYGAAGAGKSSLAKSIAVWCEQESRLLASFFFSRSDPSRDNIRRFIPTLAYTVIQVIPESQRMIEQAIESDPHIFSRSLEVQFSRLILRPLSTLSPTSHPFPHVIVIDGLDGCHDQAAQKMIVQLFSSTLSRNVGWKILITSRPEKVIQISFDDESLQCLCTRLALNQGENTPLHTSDIPVQDLLGIPAPEQFIAPVPSSMARISMTLKNTGDRWITYSYCEDGREHCGTLEDNEISENPIDFYLNFLYSFTLQSTGYSKRISRTFTVDEDWDLAECFN